MREILFRGKTEKGEWVFGDLLHPDLYGNGYSIEDFSKEKDNCCDVIPETVGQYIGLTDKHGKKIFEGDILNMHGGCAEMDEREYVIQVIVKYSRTGYGAEIGFLGFTKSGMRIPLMCEGALTVIGNIHDNPELLENPYLLKGGEG